MVKAPLLALENSALILYLPGGIGVQIARAYFVPNWHYQFLYFTCVPSFYRFRSALRLFRFVFYHSCVQVRMIIMGQPTGSYCMHIPHSIQFIDFPNTYTHTTIDSLKYTNQNLELLHIVMQSILFLFVAIYLFIFFLHIKHKSNKSSDRIFNLILLIELKKKKRYTKGQQIAQTSTI